MTVEIATVEIATVEIAHVMATATSQIVFGNNARSTTECSDVHIRMIHLRQANKREVDLLAFRQLQTEDLFTDMTLVLKVRHP